MPFPSPATPCPNIEGKLAWMNELEKSTCLDETKDISIRLQPILKLGVEGGSEEATRAMIQSGARFRPSTVPLAGVARMKFFINFNVSPP